MTKYCWWVSPSGSSTGFVQRDQFARRDGQGEAHLAVEGERVVDGGCYCHSVPIVCTPIIGTVDGMDEIVRPNPSSRSLPPLGPGHPPGCCRGLPGARGRQPGTAAGTLPAVSCATVSTSMISFLLGIRDIRS